MYLIFVKFPPTSLYFSLSLIFLYQLIQLETFCLIFLLLFISWKIQFRGIN